MVVVAVKKVDKLGPGAMDRSVLRFLKEHRSYTIWEDEVKLKPTTY